MSGLRTSLPKVSYITYLDIWMFICLLFTGSTFLEILIMQVFGCKQVNILGHNDTTYHGSYCMVSSLSGDTVILQAQ